MELLELLKKWYTVLTIGSISATYLLYWLHMWGWFFPLFLLIFLFIRFTTVEEGTTKIIMRWKGVVKVFLQWRGYELTNDGNVVLTGKARPRYGGLRVWLGLPIDEVYRYKLRWHSVEEVEGKRIPEFHEKMVDYVLVRPDRYWLKTPRLETKDGHFPDIEWLIGMRCINPEKTIFKAPHNWVENVLSQITPVLRLLARQYNLAELINLSRDEIWEAMMKISEGERIIENLENEWGVKIEEKEIAIFDISPPPGYQEVLAAEAKMRLEAKARAERLMGTIVNAVVRATGQDESDVQRDFLDNPEEFYKKHQELISSILSIISMEEKLYLRIETSGAGPIEGALLRLISAWKRITTGEKKEAKKFQNNKKGKVNIQELQEKYKELYFKWKKEKDPRKKERLWKQMKEITEELSK